MASGNKGSIARIAAVVILALTAAYVVEIVRGRVVGEHRLGINDITLIAVVSFVCALSLFPEIIGRLSRVELPGIKLELEKVKAKQEEQEDTLKTLRLILPILLPDNERAHLRNLANGNCREYSGAGIVRSELRRLRSIGLIQRKDNHSIGEMRDGVTFDLAQYVELTNAGREWLRRLSELDGGNFEDIE